MHGKLLFIVPIYFRSLEEHGKEYQKKYAEFLNRKKNRYKKFFDKELDEDPSKLEMEFQNCWYSWHYTQIIKIVEIRYEDNNLKAYLYTVEATRFRAIMNRKIFKYEGKIGDVSFLGSHRDNDKIRKDIFQFIDSLIIRNKKYYVDKTLVENILPLIDFQKID